MAATQFPPTQNFDRLLKEVDSKPLRAIMKKSKESNRPIDSFCAGRGLTFKEALGVLKWQLLKSRYHRY